MQILMWSLLILQSSGLFGPSGMIFWLLFLVIIYFFMIRPQSKRQREQRLFMEGLAKGVEVVTASGLLGKINKIDGEIVTLEVAPKVFIRVTKSSISKEMTQSIYATTTAQPKKVEDTPAPKAEDQAPAE